MINPSCSQLKGEIYNLSRINLGPHLSVVPRGKNDVQMMKRSISQIMTCMILVLYDSHEMAVNFSTPVAQKLDKIGCFPSLEMSNEDCISYRFGFIENVNALE